MKKLFLLLVAVAIILAAYYVKDNGFTMPKEVKVDEEPARVAFFAERNAQNFISYTDADYGFSVKYPVGFAAELDPVTGGRLSFKAFLSRELFEVLRVDVFNQSMSKNDLDDLQAEQSKEMQFVSRKTLNAKGKSFEFMEFKARNPYSETPITILQGVFQSCDGKSGAYSAIASAAIPDSLPQDKDMGLYFIFNFAC